MMDAFYRCYMTARGTIPLKKEVAEIIVSLFGPGPFSCHGDRASGAIVLEGQATGAENGVKMQKHGVGNIMYLEVPLEAIRSVLRCTQQKNIEAQRVELCCSKARKEVFIKLY